MMTASRDHLMMEVRIIHSRKCSSPTRKRPTKAQRRRRRRRKVNKESVEGNCEDRFFTYEVDMLFYTIMYTLLIEICTAIVMRNLKVVNAKMLYFLLHHYAHATVLPFYPRQLLHADDLATAFSPHNHLKSPLHPKSHA